MAFSQRDMWYEAVKSWCNNDFSGVDIDSAPLEVIKAVDIMVAEDSNRSYGKTSKTIQGVVVESYNAEAMPKVVKQMLYRYRKMVW